MDESVSYQTLRMVLAQANKEQNQHYPPHIFEAHYMLTVHWLIDQCSKLYPSTQSIIDLITPYLKKELVAVKNGLIPFPKEYRHLLNFGVYFKEDGDCREIPDEWHKKIGNNPSNAELEAFRAAEQCASDDVDNVSIGRWNKLTKSEYKRPTLKNPITCAFSGEGIKIAPYNVPFVEMRYIIKTTPYLFGYQMNPDDTYSFDIATTKEALFKENAIPYLVKGVNQLYANYVNDPQYIATAKDLRDTGLF